MRCLVMGISGMAGHTIGLYLKECGHEVHGFSRSPIDFADVMTLGDACDFDAVKKCVLSSRGGTFDVVINAIGVLNQQAEQNKLAAVLLNAALPHFISDITREMQTKIIHISTDCVFSGRIGNYTEYSPKDGESYYARTKALGELEDSKNLTLRCSIVGPDMRENGIGLFNWFMKQKEVNGYAKTMWTGLTTLELAKVVEYAAREKATGLVNMVYKENISKLELLKLFNHFVRNDTVKIHPVEGHDENKSLIRTNHDLKYEVPDYRTMVSEMADWIRRHKSLYPHYSL